MFDKKPVILIFTSWYLPGYKAGGPLQSIANLVEQLHGIFDFFIVTSDRDMGENKPYSDVKPGVWHTVGKAKVCYLSPSQQSPHNFWRLIRDTHHDIVYLNSFFDIKFTTFPLLIYRFQFKVSKRPPVVLAPRGEFSSGALRIKPGKKRFFMMASKLLGLHNKVVWQATSMQEFDDIFHVVNQRGCDIRVASNLPRRVAHSPRFTLRPAGSPLRVVFLSRISPKKNLLGALEILARVKVPVVFTIYGPREDVSYWVRCENFIASLPSNIKVVYAGPVKPVDVIDLLSQQDLFFLPTHGENYGHAIVEAFQAGLPVLISDLTPWRNLAAKGLGEDISLDKPDKFSNFIDQFSVMSNEDLIEMRTRILEKAAEIENVAAAVEANRRLFEAG